MYNLFREEISGDRVAFDINNIHYMMIAGVVIIIFSIILFRNSRQEAEPFAVALFSKETKLVLSLFLGILGIAFIFFDLGLRIDRPMRGKNSNSHFYLETPK